MHVITTDGKNVKSDAHGVTSHLTLSGCQGWLPSQQRWSHSLCTLFQTAMLQTGTAGSETQSTSLYMKLSAANCSVYFVLSKVTVQWQPCRKRQTLGSHLKHCSGSYALSEMQQSVSVQTAWRVHLANQCWGILKCEEGPRCNLSTPQRSEQLSTVSSGNIFIMSWLVLDLVLAVIVRLQMLHVESIVRRANSTEVESMTDLEANTCIILSVITFSDVRDLHPYILHNKLFECELMWVEDSP